MTQHGPLGPEKEAGEGAPLSNASLPSVPGHAADRIRILLPKRAAELLSSFAATHSPQELAAKEQFIELPRSYRNSRSGKETLQAVMLESVISDLATFARLGALPQGSTERLTQLVEIIRNISDAKEVEVREATADLAFTARAKLASRREAAEKEVRRLSSTGAPSNSKDASSVTNRTINALCELRAIHWLSPDTFPHSELCDLGKPALESLAAKLQEGSDAALDCADFDTAESFAALQDDVLSLLQNGRLDRSPPSHLSPLPRVNKSSLPGQKPGLAALLRGARTGGGYAAIAPNLALELPFRVLESRCAAEFLKKEKAWTTLDDSPTDELLESLVDALPVSAHELASLNPAQTVQLPGGIVSVVSLLSRLRYHGTREGAITFAVTLGCQATQTELEQRPEYNAQLVAPTWIRLVKTAASWSQRSPAGRQELWADAGVELKATVARGLFVISHTFGTRLTMLLKERPPTVIGDCSRMIIDSENLGSGAQALQPHLEFRPLADLMGTLATDIAPSLSRGFKALELSEDSTTAILEKSRHFPRTFGDNDIEKAIRDFYQYIHDAATEASETESSSSIEVLSKSFNDGDVQLFVSELDRFLALATTAPEDSLVRTQYLRSADALARGYVNLITEAFNAEIADASSTEAKIESLRTQLEHFADLRDVISARDAILGPGRKNHLSEQVIMAVNERPEISIRLLNELSHELSVARSESTFKLVRLLTSIPGCLRRLHARYGSEVDYFRASAPRHST